MPLQSSAAHHTAMLLSFSTSRNTSTTRVGWIVNASRVPDSTVPRQYRLRQGAPSLLSNALMSVIASVISICLCPSRGCTSVWRPRRAGASPDVLEVARAVAGSIEG